MSNCRKIEDRKICRNCSHCKTILKSVAEGPRATVPKFVDVIDKFKCQLSPPDHEGFPIVAWDDWCGEFKAKGKEEDKDVTNR